jgi:ActR/RegA family two-component response regulator
LYGCSRNPDVEDDLDIALVLRQEFEFNKLSTTVAADGEKALRIARQKRFRAIVLDVMLPVLDGYPVAATLRGSGDQTPILILTAGPNSGGGPIPTAGGLVFIGAARDRLFRAFSARTGEELWRTKLDEIAQSVPITWQGADGN